MRILSFKPGHDGSVALLDGGKLIFALEAEKDSFPRYAEVTPSVVLDAMSLCDEIPDAVCLSGWVKGFHSVERSLNAGYFGWDESTVEVGSTTIFGRPVAMFSSTHERSHLMSAYGLSPFAQGTPCYALVWEGNIGSFYEMTADGRIVRLAQVLEDPGNKYQFAFALADPAVPEGPPAFRFENAGKMMALTAFADGADASDEERRLIDFILSQESILLGTPKSSVRWSPFHNAGVETQSFKNLAAHLSDAIFDRFAATARQLLTEGYPLLVSGGCGLNCSWNSRWQETGLFADVFVPPCTNDTGSAIGTAVDAQRHFTGDAKITWSVYAGAEFVIDTAVEDYRSRPLDLDEVAGLLADGLVLGWVQGRYEMGPRALGNRSLLAAPFDAAMRDRLNKIKGREGYRPIAPVCREEEMSTHFAGRSDSPYMLHFQEVRTPRLAAVTHVDGSARVQSVRRDQNAVLHDLLSAFHRRTGIGVLCNTSLNFRGRGFINRMSDLAEYAQDRDLDGFVVEDRLYLIRPA
ncbi:hydroxymethyl cephem carbamoyltransferase [Actinoplanes tereljensis]|uniref:carbamoyltransferase C-terminal domain-containing protein n=1 Tax=Paractinoplanes tereljensis TaxID=571912 RepID=UPI001943BD9E|nr:carbamoyltransferase C-terminal domain-containing protein [Actinoplanes tereljensis]